jgi:hypothetical protein
MLLPHLPIGEKNNIMLISSTQNYKIKKNKSILNQNLADFLYKNGHTICNL